MTTPKKISRSNSLISFFQTLKAHHKCGWGIWVLIATLLILSIIAGINLDSEKHAYVAGQIAPANVYAERAMRVENVQETEERRRQALALQPTVYDKSMDSYTKFQSQIIDIFRALNTNPDNYSDPALQKISEEISPAVADEIFPQLAQREVQNYILKHILPQIHIALDEGLVRDILSSRVGPGGIVLRDKDKNTQTTRDIRSLPDAQSFLAEISSQLRSVPELNPSSRRAINILLGALMPASLTLNLVETQRRNSDYVNSIQPVYYEIQKGELIVRSGERVTPKQQIQLQSLYSYSSQPISWHIVAGSFFCGLLFSIGLFMAPSGKPGTPLRRKDMILISVVLLFFGVAAKCVYIFGKHMDSIPLLNSFTIAFPVAGAVGLVAMVFAARRYCVVGLLLSLYCMLMFNGNYPLFIYYFLAGMLSTWLVTRAQNRQDVVWSVVPLSIGLFLIWVGVSFLIPVTISEIPMQLIAIMIHSLLSLILLFAVSPVLEMAFSYSTRFRLMELMSLEQPLMQEIMVNIPGTYHHSLVVANMVEAGAKAIGANSLLCKVAALYHDAGKLTYPEYFIENQFGAPNKHDRLAPSMSALILLSHVKKGAELAEKNKLGQEITDIIRQHHGTRLMRYFYQKAIDLGEKAQEADFSYPGPRPQSKEAAILMLADSVEASSRTLTDPTPARIKNHIDNIIRGIFAEGQLDESELTFKDLHLLSENFQRILTGIFHQRIVYPESKIKMSTQQNTAKSNGQPKTDKNGKKPFTEENTPKAAVV